MNAAAAIARVVRLAACGLAPMFGGRSGRRVSAKPQAARFRSRRTLVWFAVALLALHTAAFLLLDVVRPSLRDPEYGRRAASLRLTTSPRTRR